MRTAAVRRVLSGGICVKRYGLRSTGETDTHDYFDKVLSRKGAAPATGRDTLLAGAGKLDTRKTGSRAYPHESP